MVFTFEFAQVQVFTQVLASANLSLSIYACFMTSFWLAQLPKLLYMIRTDLKTWFLHQSLPKHKFWAVFLLLELSPVSGSTRRGKR